MFPISKEQVLLIRRDELIACIVGRTPSIANLGEAETVEYVSVRVVGTVLVDGIGGNFNADSWWNILTIREGDPF